MTQNPNREAQKRNMNALCVQIHIAQTQNSSKGVTTFVHFNCAPTNLQSSLPTLATEGLKTSYPRSHLYT